MNWQPFEIFHPEYIERLRGLRKRYLVSQHYTRGIDCTTHPKQIPILLTDYEARGGADIHLNALKHDRLAAIIDLERDAHRQKIYEMMRDDSRYCLFWAVVNSRAEIETRINRDYKEAVRRFIDRHTHWRINGSLTLRPNMDVTFGELFITLKHAGHTVRVKLDDIENG